MTEQPNGWTTQADRRRLSLWQSMRRSAAAPVLLIVVMAILCIMAAVFSSAHRADVAALENERHLFSHALAQRQAEILREAKYLAESKDALGRPGSNRDQVWIQQQIGLRLNQQLDNILVFLLDPATGSVQPLVEGASLEFDRISTVAPAELATLVTRVDSAVAEAGEYGIRGSLTQSPRSAARVQSFMGRPAIAAVAALSVDNRAGGHHAGPALVMVGFLSEAFLRDVAARLELVNLRVIGAAGAGASDHVLELLDEAGALVARFAWAPKQPGAEIIRDILPFLGVALVCFLLLAGVVLLYMRRTTATIAAGEDRMRHMAMHDPLSGLPNRMLFGDRLEDQIQEVKRGGAAAALLSIDLDHFKDVNDTLGHHVGDALIGAVAQRLCRIVRGEDLVARLGGDEFAVLTTAATDRVGLEHISRRIISTLSAPYLVAGHTLVIGASIGIVVIDRHLPAAADVMRFADMALYRAKNEGRNRACIYDAAMSADFTERKHLEGDLRIAIEHGGLALAYQTLVSPDGERIIGVEALCRWPHPVRGEVPPSQFIPVAEQSELIIPLGEWVLRRACIDGKAWPNLVVAVNVSPLQFRRPDFVDVVGRILAETGFEPTRLELELTETTLLGNVEGAENAMRRLKRMGVKLALDDFGTGYSSLLYLRTFPFDKLKIDRSFVNNIETAADAAAIVHAIVGLGRGLGMKVTAEGVENADQQLFLRAAGVHTMQGFRFGYPEDAAAITHRLDSQSSAALPAPLRRVAMAS